LSGYLVYRAEKSNKKTMKRVGFIDLQPSEAAGNISAAEFSTSHLLFSIHVFKSSSSGYEYESSMQYSEDTSSSLSVKTAHIEDFYLSLPLELLDFRMLKLPFSDAEKLKKVVPFELDTLLVERSDSVVFDTIVAGESDDGFHILVAYVKKEILKELLAGLSSLDIDPRIITSIELEAIVEGGMEDISARLLNREELSSRERISIARGALTATSINLRTGLFSYTKDDEKTGRLLRVASVLFILVVLMIHTGLALRIITAKGEASSMKREMRSLYTGLFPDEKKIINELYQMKSHMKEIREKGETVMGVEPLEFMLVLSGKKPGVVFNEISLNRELITMKGEAGSMEDIGEMKSGLSEFLTDVSISDIKPSTDGKTFFTVVARALE
jgi:type II secretory pathway component PulL